MAYTTINKSTDHFNTKLYTGNGSTQYITGVEFSPGLCWIKGRGSSAYDHQLYDVLRGVTKAIASNGADAESTQSTGLTAFDSDGFTLGSHARVNSNGDNKVAWNWKAGGSGSSNTDGTINTTYTSVNTTSGFSISTYTGTGYNATVGHGLGVAPKVVIIKNLARTENWLVGHSSIGFTKFLSLDLTNASQTTSNRFNDTAPTSTVFSVGTADGSNKSGDSFIAYCFAEKTGFSKFGKYIGTANNDGPFLFTGFKPAFVLVKIYSDGGSWYIYDNKRGPFNVNDSYLRPNSSNAETTGASFARMDFLSNGFKLRDNQNLNGSYNYIYMAFAEEPLVSSNGVPATAR